MQYLHDGSGCPATIPELAKLRTRARPFAGEKGSYPEESRGDIRLQCVDRQSTATGRTVHGGELFGLRAIGEGQWKAVWMPPPQGKGAWELYNLAKDPTEMHDLSVTEPERMDGDARCVRIG